MCLSLEAVKVYSLFTNRTSTVTSRISEKFQLNCCMPRKWPSLTHFKGMLEDIDGGGDLQRFSGQVGTPTYCTWTTETQDSSCAFCSCNTAKATSTTSVIKYPTILVKNIFVLSIHSISTPSNCIPLLIPPLLIPIKSHILPTTLFLKDITYGKASFYALSSCSKRVTHH